MKDHFLNCFISGIIASSIASLIDIVLVSVIKFGSLRFLDFASIFIYGGKALNLPEEIFAQFGELVFSGLVGVLFGYLVPINKYHVLKGAIYGVIVWFVIYGIVIMYKVPVLKDIPLASSLENTLASIIYGVILAIIMNYLIKHNIGRKE